MDNTIDILRNLPQVQEFLEIFNRSNDHKGWIFTGSKVMCNPVPDGGDIDIFCVYNAWFSSALQSAGYEISPHEEYPNENIRACYRKGDVNVIACTDAHTFDLWVKATYLGTHLNLQQKDQRRVLFQFITEGIIRNTTGPVTNGRQSDKHSMDFPF